MVHDPHASASRMSLAVKPFVWSTLHWGVGCCCGSR